MTTRYILRLQFGWHQDVDGTIDRLLRLCDEATVDEVMLFFFAEEMNNGHDTLDEIRRWISFSAPIIAALREAGVSVTLNPWHSLLHVDRGRTLKPSQQGWQRMVDPDGRIATAVVCPLDTGWRAYYLETLDLYAKADFDAIWVDDDIRYHNHGDLKWGGCFCPLHLQAFSERVGRQVAREELEAACTAPGPPHPWRGLWMDLWDEQQTALITQWRECVESHGKRLGLMSSLPEQHAAEGRRWSSWWKAMGGERALHRPHFWPYAEVTGCQLPLSIHIMDQNRSIQPPDVSVQPEIESVPYSPWNKSLRQTAAQMTMAQVFGASGLQLSIYDHMGNDPDDDPSRALFLKQWRPALNQVSAWFPPSLRTRGIGVPWSEDMGRHLHTAIGDSWAELVCPSRGWAAWLGAAGLATTVHADGNVIALGGPVVHAFDDGQVAEWLHRGVLLDGYAARLLAQRGFGKYMGMEELSGITQNDRPYAVEACVHADFIFRCGAVISVNSEFFTPYGQKLVQGIVSPGAFEITELRGPRQERMGHGITGFVNEWGGRVVITPWNADTSPHMNHLRADQLAKICAFLNGGPACVGVSGGAWLTPLLLTDASGWRLVIWNGGDTVSSVRCHGPVDIASIKFAYLLKSDASMIPVPIHDPTIQLPVPMDPWECLVIGGE